MSDRVAEGQAIDLEQWCEDHPDLAADLRQLWGAVLVADATGVAQRPRAASSTAGEPADGGLWQPIALPTRIGDYLLLEELGRGGMGVVFLARQISLDREVAVKMILRERLASDADRQRFLAEAAATARLEHPNIVPIYEVDDMDGRPFFSMKYIHGLTLADRLHEGPLPQRAAAKIVVPIARAIAEAHRHGILHRDIKPSNILLSDDGPPMITDFGLAKQDHAPHSLTQSGMILGTPAYMAPEQAAARREQLGPASDVYSLGSVLYHALTGRAPLIADTPVELMMKVIEQDPPPPRVLRPNLNRDLEMIVVRCLQKPPDLRYQDADQLADDLEAFLNNEPVAARSGRFSQIVARMFRDTHHVTVLENWGVLWMWHSLALLIACFLTWLLQQNGVQNRIAYGMLWSVGLGTWAGVFWMLRRRLGPVTFIERQTAHVWAASMIGVMVLFPLEWWMQLPVLTLSPVLGIVTAMVFLIKAGMFSGAFYLQFAALLATSIAMALYPQAAHLIFGVVAAVCFFVPGLKYSRQRIESQQRP
ncbi:serine/threonine-protein kinase [Roseimaritima sediminicola]|uniref:serine/threonine-protein kinase n=1 Tax=Roseimaritima sediminicola TaxID=2662066 RepID=UPI0012983874|nr:serine/threonine-protein kinase [Roseimaritima sediminicola]